MRPSFDKDKNIHYTANEWSDVEPEGVESTDGEGGLLTLAQCTSLPSSVSRQSTIRKTSSLTIPPARFWRKGAPVLDPAGSGARMYYTPQIRMRTLLAMIRKVMRLTLLRTLRVP